MSQDSWNLLYHITGFSTECVWVRFLSYQEIGEFFLTWSLDKTVEVNNSICSGALDSVDDQMYSCFNLSTWFHLSRDVCDGLHQKERLVLESSYLVVFLQRNRVPVRLQRDSLFFRQFLQSLSWNSGRSLLRGQFVPLQCSLCWNVFLNIQK